MYQPRVDRLGAAGFRGYEISNWARPGHESRHNLVYWQRRPYEAVGPGAHAFDGAERRWNAARLDGYLAALRRPTALARAAARAARRPSTTRPPRRRRRSSACASPTGLAAAGGGAGSPLAPHLAWAREVGLVEPFTEPAAEPRVRLTRAAGCSATSCSRGCSEVPASPLGGAVAMSRVAHDGRDRR